MDEYGEEPRGPPEFGCCLPPGECCMPGLHFESECHTVADYEAEIEIKDGDTYWMGTKVLPCPKCGIAPTNVDDCGEFGNPDCPYFGIGREEYVGEVMQMRRMQ